MEKTILMFSALKIWSVGDKQGAPSFYETICGYQRNGWKVILVVPYDVQDVTLDGVEVITAREMSVVSKPNKYQQFFENIRYNIKLDKVFWQTGKEILERRLKNHSNTIIYAYEVHAVNVCRKLAKKYRIPLITRFQGTIMYNKSSSLINQIGYYPHYQALKTHSDMVVMTNDGTKGEEYLRRIGNTSKVLFLRNGVDIQKASCEISSEEIKQKLNIEENEFILMTVSRLVNWKRIDRAILAMPAVLREKKNCKLVIVGDGTEKQNLIKLSEQLEVSDNVIFVGAIAQKDVPNYLQIADLFLSLYDLGNVGNPIYEAMKCGKAIVTLNNGDTAKLLTNGETGILLEMDEIPQLPAIILRMLEDDKYRKRLGENAQKYADDNFWTWNDRMKYECTETEKLLLG